MKLVAGAKTLKPLSRLAPSTLAPSRRNGERHFGAALEQKMRRSRAVELDVIRMGGDKKSRSRGEQRLGAIGVIGRGLRAVGLPGYGVPPALLAMSFR